MGANSRRLVDEQRVVRLKHQAAVGLDVRRGLGVWRALGLGAPRSLGTRCGLGARCSLSVPRDLVVPRGLGGLGVCELELAHAPLHHVGVAAGELVAERPEPELHPSGRHAAEIRALERGRSLGILKQPLGPPGGAVSSPATTPQKRCAAAIPMEMKLKINPPTPFQYQVHPPRPKPKGNSQLASRQSGPEGATRGYLANERTLEGSHPRGGGRCRGNKHPPPCARWPGTFGS